MVYIGLCARHAKYNGQLGLGYKPAHIRHKSFPHCHFGESQRLVLNNGWLIFFLLLVRVVNSFNGDWL